MQFYSQRVWLNYCSQDFNDFISCTFRQSILGVLLLSSASSSSIGSVLDPKLLSFIFFFRNALRLWASRSQDVKPNILVFSDEKDNSLQHTKEEPLISGGVIYNNKCCNIIIVKTNESIV